MFVPGQQNKSNPIPVQSRCSQLNKPTLATSIQTFQSEEHQTQVRALCTQVESHYKFIIIITELYGLCKCMCVCNQNVSLHPTVTNTYNRL